MSKFIDTINIRIKAGKGGPGSVHFHREKFIPKGGPDGGDGGDGGNVYIKINPQAYNLDHLNANKIYKAENGVPGSGEKKYGKKGKDIYITVPPGVVIKDLESEEILFNAGREILKQENNAFVICAGGKGGMGNSHFATSVNQAPKYAQSGLPGEERTIQIDLKLIADIGFVGLPNAGKSTLLSKLTNATPKIADYPFTTLIPQLGTLLMETDKGPIVIKLADIPGIIKGAHKGSGLGLSFLRHIERVYAIFFIIEITDQDPIYSMEILMNELKSYSEELMKKPFVVMFNKMDMVEEKDRAEFKNLFQEEFQKKFSIQEKDIVFISALQDEGLDQVQKLILEKHELMI